MPAISECIDGFLTQTQAARRLGVSEGSVRYYTKIGRLPAVLIAGRKVYRVAAVDQFAREVGRAFTPTN